MESRSARWRVAVAAGLALLLGVATYIAVVKGGGRTRRSLPEPSARGLLRPLARGPDFRFTGKLPPLRAVPTGPVVPPGIRSAVTEIERLYREAGDPSDVVAFLDAQERLLWIGMGNAVEEGVKALLRVVPDHPRALALLAAVRYEQGRRDEIPPLAEVALRGNPSEYLALVYRAAFRAPEGKVAAAQADLANAEAADPQRPEAPSFHGAMLFERYRFGEALPYLRRALLHEPDPTSGRVAYARLASAYADLFDGRRVLDLPVGFAPVEVPLARRPEIPAVRVRVNGGRDGWMVLDTGSDVVRLPRRHRSLAVVREDAQVETLGAGSSKPTALPGRLESIEIGGLVIRNVPVRVEAEEYEEPDPEVLGAIGTVFLSRFHATIDFFGSRLRLEPAGSTVGLSFRGVFPPDGGVVGGTPFLRVNNQIFVRVRLGGGSERTFMLDTGTSAVAVDREVLRREFAVTDGDPRTTPVTGRGIAGRPVPTFYFPLPVPLVFGNTPVHGLTALAEDFREQNLLRRTDLAGIVGLGLLSSTCLTLDFERQEVSFLLSGTPVRGR